MASRDTEVGSWLQYNPSRSTGGARDEASVQIPPAAGPDRNLLVTGFTRPREEGIRIDMFSSTPRIRAAALAAMALLTATTIIPAAPAAAAPADQTEAAAAAGDWIARELDAENPSFDAFGRTGARTDVIFALAAAGNNQGSSRQALAELAAGAADYVGDPVSPGAAAKVLLAVLVNRDDPVAFLPGRDIEAELRSTIRPDGSFADDPFNHSLAMLALAATTDGVPEKAVDWLMSRQCSSGEFTFMGCPGDPTSPDIDSTALALQALVAAGGDGPAALAAGFLVDTQNPDGSWPSAFGDPNANTAGVAGQALRAAGEVEAADLAADFVMSLQTNDGGIRFSAADPAADGFATLQGVLALGAPAYHELETRPYTDVAWADPFAGEIDWLGDRGITRGCDPPTNDHFCPDDPVTRGQMAAFLHRALGDALPAGTPTDFGDDDGSVFETDIEWLAATGITRGCNPPTNDRFCPDDPITRGQMATFLYRALAG